jgi:NAD(P)-dependent dehydrogenase (short-subunit alcohol dehydrogenase family)
MSYEALKGKWFLALGASSGFGAAACLSMAKKGMNILGVHLDRKGTMPMVEELLASLRAQGVQVHFFNANAADADKRAEIISEIKTILGEDGRIRVFLHSLAFGALRAFLEEGNSGLTREQMDMTADVMGHSLVYWVQDLMAADLFEKNGRVFAMTSSGATRVMPNYGAVSAAKAVIESHIRQLAMELAPYGITANAIRAGVTDTPALRKIPSHEKFIELALSRNPNGRLTTPADVAEAIAVLSEPGAYWINGNTLGIDGGEDIVG